MVFAQIKKLFCCCYCCSIDVIATWLCNTHEVHSLILFCGRFCPPISPSNMLKFPASFVSHPLRPYVFFQCSWNGRYHLNLQIDWVGIFWFTFCSWRRKPCYCLWEEKMRRFCWLFTPICFAGVFHYFIDGFWGTLSEWFS